MQSDLVKIRQSYAEVTATQKRMEKQKELADNTAADWYKRAQLALQKGDEELAKEALSRRQKQIELSSEIGKQLDLQTNSLEKLYTAMTALDVKIAEAKREKEVLIARAKTAKTSVKVNDMLNTVSGSNSMEAFERMKAKVQGLEAQADVAGELAATSSGTTKSIEDRFAALEGGTKVDEELEMLKRQLPGSKTEIPSLPAPKAVSEAEPMSEIDIEYEQLKKELGKK
jgi:phage shock protein A